MILKCGVMTINRCPKIQRGASEAEGLLALLRSVGVSVRDIDTGVLRSNFKQNRSPVEKVPNTAGDGRLEPNEIYGAAIKKLEEEEDRFVATNGRSGRPFTDLVSNCSTFRVPWLFNDFNTKTTRDNRTLLHIAAKIAAIKKSIRHRSDTYEYKSALLAKLVSWMEGSLNRTGYISVESTNLQMANGHLGDCTELSRFAYAIFRMAGLKPEFLIVTKHAFNPSIRYHMAVGIPIHPSFPDFLTQVDLYHKDFVKDLYRHPGRVSASPQTMLAVGAVTEGFHILHNSLPSTPAQALFDQTFKHYSLALTFDEHFPDAHYNLASVLYELGNRMELAKEFNDKALKLRPDMREALELKQRLQRSAIKTPQ